MEDPQCEVDTLGLTNQIKLDNSTSFNLLNSSKTLKIKSININGLADQHRLWRLFHYFVATETDIMWIQETRKFSTLENAPEIKRNMFYCTDPKSENSNGMAVLINRKRFDILDKILTPQLIILEIRDIIDDQRITIINTYINPTSHRKTSNKQILEKMHQCLAISIINNRKIVIWGDFNQEFNNQRSHFKEHGLKCSSFKYTRPQSNSELDMIGTTFENTIFNKDYKDFMSDHECLEAMIKCNKERQIDLLEKKISKKSLEIISTESVKRILQTSHSWKVVRNQILERIKLSLPTLWYSPKYVSIWSKITRGEITVMNIRQKIQKAVNKLNSNQTPSSELWSISKQLNEDLKKKESSFLLGIEINGEQTYNKYKIRMEVSKYYKQKFREENETELNNKIISNLYIKYELKDHFQNLIIDGLSKEMERFPIHTTYGPDLILPKSLEDNDFRTELKWYIFKVMSCNNGSISEESLIGRLILITKTGSPIAKIEKTRPIVVQTLMVRLIEKVIKTKLEEWKRWRNLESDSYQCGFQKKLNNCQSYQGKIIFEK